MKQKTKKSKPSVSIDFDTPPQADNVPGASTQLASEDTVSGLETTAEIKMDETIVEDTSTTYVEAEKVKIDFPFSDKIREKVPKVFAVAETAATQWKNNEKFENLGVEHPVAEIALAKVLEKAKGVERKLDEKGIISAAKMGIQVAKFQAEEIIKKLKK